MTLTQLFTAIANAIRAKMGTSNLIPAENFPTKIAEIQTGKLTKEEYNEAQDDLDDILENTVVPSGTINITTNGIIDVTNYVQANVNVENEYNAKMSNKLGSFGIAGCLTEIPDNIEIYNTNSLYQAFYNCASLISIPQIDTSNVISMRQAFSNCRSLTSMPLLNTSNVTDMYQAFYNCINLTSIPQIDTREVTNTQQMFRSCPSLISLPKLDISKTTNMADMFWDCGNLSEESLNNILAMCIDATSYTGKKTLKYIGLSSTQAETCQTLSNYQAFLDAGWTTEY